MEAAMDSNHPSQNLAHGTSDHRSPGPRLYVPPAGLVPVMQEQFNYLLSHSSAACTPECPACRRLEQIKCCLLQPFTC
jgi:hypothetical protein